MAHEGITLTELDAILDGDEATRADRGAAALTDPLAALCSTLAGRYPDDPDIRSLAASVRALAERAEAAEFDAECTDTDARLLADELQASRFVGALLCKVASLPR
ncbi:MAG TPA: hypothetical protein VNO84_10760 [Burkholderiaceae bacterium]|nr:hypothetical protein [Burkholderiaceae bacterium]